MLPASRATFPGTGISVVPSDLDAWSPGAHGMVTLITYQKDKLQTPDTRGHC